ncbi:cutinase [Mycena alexandri]|uniref:Cutinase n=1 Tax=Mycena alexandri TaxID=1745969 RepID=A0AAD6S6Z8_9AGAR|nr:cutinase [Mycena alexandri]
MKVSLVFTSVFFISLAAAAAVVVPEVPAFPVPAASSFPNDTENGLSGPCATLTFLFARGTFETGNVGERVGPPLISQLRDFYGTSITVQGVDYDASLLGYLQGGSPSGSATLVDLINTAVSMCPKTTVILGGYSQGAQLVHNAAAEISSAVSERIAAVVLFGDPNDVAFGGSSSPVGVIPSNKVDNFCHTDDIICTGAGGKAEHLNYDMDVTAAFTFILIKVSR